MFRRRKLVLILAVVFLFLAVLSGFLRSQYAVPILMYHSVSPFAQPANRLAVTEDTFQRQMHFLKTHHYNVLHLETIADLIRAKRPLPRKTVAITLDDGYKDNYAYAFPVLKKYNLPATVFVIVDEIGRADRLSWDEIRKMRAAGSISIGSHAMGPEPLVNIKSEEEIKRQILFSKKILEKKLGRKVTAFSYPEGRFNPLIRQLVIDAGYGLAVSTNPGKKFSNNDVFALKRLRISENARNLFVFWVEASGYYNFMREHRHK